MRHSVDGGKLIKRIVLTTLLLGVTGGLAWLFSRPAVPATCDAREAYRFVSMMEERYHFRVMTRDHSRPAVYAKPGGLVTEVFVYGDYSPQEQDEICAIARAAHKEAAGKPVHLYFYPRELQNVELKHMERIDFIHHSPSP